MTRDKRQTTPPSKFQRSSRWKWILGGTIVLTTVFWEYVWMLIREILTNFVPILMTPVILEVSLFLMGLALVVVWNHLRMKREAADEWVYLSQVDAESELEQVAESLRKRAGGSVFREDAGKVDEEMLGIGKVEGFLGLGMLDEASEELMQITEGRRLEEQSSAILKLRLELCLRQKGTEAAQALEESWKAQGIELGA